MDLNNVHGGALLQNLLLEQTFDVNEILKRSQDMTQLTPSTDRSMDGKLASGSRIRDSSDGMSFAGMSFGAPDSFSIGKSVSTIGSRPSYAISKYILRKISRYFDLFIDRPGENLLNEPLGNDEPFGAEMSIYDDLLNMVNASQAVTKGQNSYVCCLYLDALN